jgi:formamidopyrimidine-DNA glycosylase
VPELPEVETIARDVRPDVEGRRILRARVLKPDILRKVTPRVFERRLEGRLVTAVFRRAKHVVMTLDDGDRVIVQPGMTGSLHIANGVTNPDPYVTILFALDSGKRLVHRDVRRIGAVYLHGPEEWAAYDRNLGPEPLEPAFTPACLAEALANGRLAVKKALMDQRRLAGVGNIYANEALWMARIDPSSEARGISAAETKRLHRAIVDILRRAIRGRGTTVRDYRTGTGERGRFQSRLAVYGRDGRACRRCGRRIVLTHAIDARATYFCPGCQR